MESPVVDEKRKESEMSRTMTKRIVWTIAALAALSFVAAMLLHKHDEPKIIGNVSSTDVTAISRSVRKSFRDIRMNDMTTAFKYRDYGRVMACLQFLFRYKVSYIEAVSTNVVAVWIGIGTNEPRTRIPFLKTNGAWEVTSLRLLPPRRGTSSPTNIAPVYQGTVVR